ncbi:pyridoxamine 5'-phosphate oxidase family protein [Candidatus Parcubacteria bacterium]|nr:pyridoxamine 5'-phosphate oxidase family protein [Candidatus Parcubacteria bacterium]
MVEIDEAVKQKIKQFIANKDVCVIATCSENKPRASTVNYVSDDFTLYAVTSEKSTKAKNVGINSNVSVAIDNQGKQERACLQAEGVAKVLSGIEAEQAKEFYSQKRDLSHHEPELVDTVLKIKLKEVMFTDYVKGVLKVYKFKLYNGSKALSPALP